MITPCPVKLWYPFVSRPAKTEDKAKFVLSINVNDQMSETLRKMAVMVRVIEVCGYDPQRLLEYRPETVAEWAARHGWHTGGAVTGRWSGRSLPDYEYVLPKGRIPYLFPGEKIEMTPYPESDYGGIEARVMAFYGTPREREPSFYRYQKGAASFREALEKNARFEATLRQYQAQMKASIDRAMINAMLAIYVDTPSREARISRLVYSRDPRQRKRGRRLRKRGLRLREKSRQPFLWDDMAEMPNPAEDLKAVFNKNLGEPYDPERYRKD